MNIDADDESECFSFVLVTDEYTTFWMNWLNIDAEAEDEDFCFVLVASEVNRCLARYSPRATTTN